MNTLYFKYALEVEHTHSITKAAYNLYMAQPNLSKAIKELEETLGIVIFERTSKGVIPTAKGKEFLEYAKKILIQIEKMESLQLSENKKCQNFNIAVPGSSYISSCISKFIAKLDTEQDIDVNIKEMNSADIINAVSDGQYNMGVIHYPVEYENYFLDFLKDKNLMYEMIWEFEHLLIMSQDSPIAEKLDITKEDLEHLIEVIHGDAYVPYINGMPKKNISSKRITLYERSGQLELLHNVPNTFMWASPVPEATLNRYGLIHRKCTHLATKCKDVIIFPEGYKFTELDKKFADELYSAKNSVSFSEYV